jgi:hypothetical protein
MNPPAVAVCYIVDVGMQAGGRSGSSSVVIFPQSRKPKCPHAVVVDCGDRSRTTLRLLQDHKISRIDHIFISHNDRDHAGGILDLVNAFRNRVGQVWLLQDRPGPDIGYFPELRRFKDAGFIKGIRWLQRDEGEVCLLHGEGPIGHDDGAAWSIHLLYPLSVSDVLDPQIMGDPNAGCAVLMLECGEGEGRGRILFPGDARIETLRRAQRSFSSPNQPSRPIRCDVLVAPHHGGAVRRGSRMGREQYETLFREVLNCTFAVVSVATDNRDGHPHEEHILALSSASESVLCTQITHQCCGDPRAHHPGILGPFRGVPQASDAADGSLGIACAGTVVVDIGPFPLEPRRWMDHRRAVDRLHQAASTSNPPVPLCRRRTPAPARRLPPRRLRLPRIAVL